MFRKLAGSGSAAAVLLLLIAVWTAPALHAAEGDGQDRAKAIDVNSAPAVELEKLPGVGPALAKRIVDFREKNGPFGSVNDLLKVQGIGEKSLARFRDRVVASKPKKK
jgi:competence protein ComEA